MVTLSKNGKVYGRVIFLAAVIALAGMVALSGITENSSAKAKDLTIRCVGSDGAVKESSAAEDELTFSKEAGAYPDSAIALDIVSEKGLEVRYTTDGSTPSKQNGKDAAGGIVLSGDVNGGDVNGSFIDKINDEAAQTGWRYDPQLMRNIAIPNAAVVRACALLPGGTAGKVYTKTYFPGTDLADDFGCTVISITCEPEDLLGFRNGILARGRIFKENAVYNWARIVAGDDLFIKANYSQKGKEWERPANIEVFSGKDGRQTALFESKCGIRVQGTTSRRFSQKSFNIYFRDDYGKKKMDMELIDGNTDVNGTSISTYKSFTLRNGGNDADTTKFRNAMIQEMLQGFGFETQRAEPAVLFLNGEFFGVYTLNEKYSSHFVESRYGIDKDDVIIIDEGEVDDAEDEDVAKELYREFKRIIGKDLSVQGNWQRFCDTVDIRSLADYYAAQIYIGNLDWNETEMKDCRIWRTVSSDDAAPADGRWRWMLYDTEYSCGIYGYEKNSPGYDHLNAMLKSGRYPLFSRVMERGEFRKKLADSLERVKGSMTEERFDAECVKWINTVHQRDLLKMNLLRFGYPLDESFDDSQPSSELSRMKSFIRERPNTIDRLIMELSKSDI